MIAALLSIAALSSKPHGEAKVSPLQPGADLESSSQTTQGLFGSLGGLLPSKSQPPPVTLRKETSNRQDVPAEAHAEEAAEMLLAQARRHKPLLQVTALFTHHVQPPA